MVICLHTSYASILNILFCDISSWEKPHIEEIEEEHNVVVNSGQISVELSLRHPDTEVLSVFVSSCLTSDLLQYFPRLKIICTRSTGFDHIDIEYCKKHDIAVYNVPHYGENTVAEHTFALILSLSRNIHKSYQRTMQNDFSIKGLIGFDLQGKTLGVVGGGNIGQHVIRIAKGFGMEVVVYDTKNDLKLAGSLGFQYVDMPKLLSCSDIISLHLPYTINTHHMIDTKAFNRMKKGAIVINTARGAVIDTEALVRALDSKQIAGAALDVLEGEHMLLADTVVTNEKQVRKRALTISRNLIQRDNVLYTPHMAFYSKEAVERIISTSIITIQTLSGGGAREEYRIV